jgi:hypothetical protein
LEEANAKKDEIYEKVNAGDDGNPEDDIDKFDPDS